ncbi:MAG TPA: NUDIX hydrolase [Candidatus Paceibacterota bacterium]
MILQVGVKIFLKNPEGKYLFVRRSPEKYPGVKGEWDIPGGRINPGSLLIENLRREVKEETQLEITSEPRLIHAQDIIPNEERHIVRLSYIGETNGEPILDTSENIEYRWLSLEEIKRQENIDIYVKEIVDKDYLNRR